MATFTLNTMTTLELLRKLLEEVKEETKQAKNPADVERIRAKQELIDRGIDIVNEDRDEKKADSIVVIDDKAYDTNEARLDDERSPDEIPY